MPGSGHIIIENNAMIVISSKNNIIGVSEQDIEHHFIKPDGSRHMMNDPVHDPAHDPAHDINNLPHHTAESIGDPYIITYNNTFNKIPNKTAYYRLFEYDNMFINCLVDHKDIKNELLNYINVTKSELLMDSEYLITSGYWNSKIYINSEKFNMTFDIENKQCFIDSESRKYFTFDNKISLKNKNRFSH